VTGSLESGRRVVKRAVRRVLHRTAVPAYSWLYYNEGWRTWRDTYWLGVRTLKLPSDLWVYQEILHELPPDLIVETGTRFGGSALYLATICDAMDHGEIVTIDIEARHDRPQHPRIEYLTGSSVDPDVVARVGARAEDAGTVMVILDSDHSREHVLAELRAYAPLVSPGSYLIVEDTTVNGHPLAKSHGPGPWEALEAFLPDPRFEVDRGREKFLVTWNPRGYLRRTTGGGGDGQRRCP
jgi:cephalosporin hydroxylase